MQNGHRNHARVRDTTTRTRGACGKVRLSAAREEQRGLSLLEVLVATVLTVVMVIAIMNACIHQQALQRLDSEINYVYLTCRTRLDEMRAKPLSELRELDGAGFAVVGSNGVTPLVKAVPGDPDGLPGHIQIREERAAGGRALYRIETTVQWLGATGRHSVTYTTMWGGVQ